MNDALAALAAELRKTPTANTEKAIGDICRAVAKSLYDGGLNFAAAICFEGIWYVCGPEGMT